MKKSCSLKLNIYFPLYQLPLQYKITKLECNELKEIDITNNIWHYFDDIIKIIDLDNILIDENSCKNIWVFDISCKTLFVVKLLRFRFNTLDEVNIVYDRIRYLVLISPEKYDAIYDKAGNCINQKRWYYINYFPYFLNHWHCIMLLLYLLSLFLIKIKISFNEIHF